MFNRRAVALWFALGAASSMSACGAAVDEPVVEDVDAVEAPFEPTFSRDPRLHRPHPLPPDWRRPLRCLSDPHKQYVSRDPDRCAAIRFYCPVGTPFFDDCGCGCEVENLLE